MKIIKKLISLDFWLKIFPIIALFTCILLIYFIYDNSNLQHAELNYKNLKNFMTFYEFPLKLFLISLTIWGILVAYHTYTQTKEQFIIINSAWLKTEVKPIFVPYIENKNILKLFIRYEIENTGNTPAENFTFDIDITTDINDVEIPKSSHTPESIYPHHPFYYNIGIGENINMCKRIMDDKPTFFITTNINYTTLNKIQYTIEEQYDLKYGELPRLIESKSIKHN